MTCATVEDSGPNPPWGRSLVWWVILPWRLGAFGLQVDFKPRALSCSGGRLSTCDPHATPWVVLGAVNSEDPIESTAKQKKKKKKEEKEEEKENRK